MNGCNECNKWKQKHDHIFAEVRRQSERIAALEKACKSGEKLKFFHQAFADDNTIVFYSVEARDAFDTFNILLREAGYLKESGE